MALGLAIVGYGRAGRVQREAAAAAGVDVLHVVDERASVEAQLDQARFSRDLALALADPAVAAVAVCTPTATHAAVARAALEAGKHVLCEKPLCESRAEARALYALAAARGRLLYTAYNRRHDARWARFRAEVEEGGPPSAVTVLCRDHPFPPAAYLASCGGILRDCAVHDLDQIFLLLGDTPARVTATVDEAGETSHVALVMHGGCRVALHHARHAPSYDQRAWAVLPRGLAELTNPDAVVASAGIGSAPPLAAAPDAAPDAVGSPGSAPPAPASPVARLTFQARYRRSYAAQMADFAARAAAGEVAPNVSLAHCELLERVLEAAERSAREGVEVPLKTLRAYEAAEGRVRALYREARRRQDAGFVARLRATYAPGGGRAMGVRAALEALDKLVDLSDPDATLPNSVHALQTAEALRRDGLPRWLQLVGLIHDLGKVLALHPRACDEDGTSAATQWALVGDTFVTGAPRPAALVYPEFNAEAPEEDRCDDGPATGRYAPGCGLDATLVSYGHDEYLYQVLRAAGEAVTLPAPAFAIVRYHSLYAWHTGGAYGALASREDEAMLGWITLFNRYDLYSKRDAVVDRAAVWEYYEALAAEYLPAALPF